MKNFVDLFTPILMGTDYPVEFPLDLVFSDKQRLVAYYAQKTTLFTSSTTDIIRHYGDYVTVPMHFDESELTSVATRVLVQAVLDQNVVVYDEEGDNFTKRLIAVMKTMFQRSHMNSSSRLKHILVPNYCKVPEETQRYAREVAMVNIHAVNFIEFEDIFKQMGGQLPAGRKYMCLGVSSDADTFMLPQQGNKFGLAVLDRSQILLGAY